MPTKQIKQRISRSEHSLDECHLFSLLLRVVRSPALCSSLSLSADCWETKRGGGGDAVSLTRGDRPWTPCWFKFVADVTQVCCFCFCVFSYWTLYWFVLWALLKIREMIYISYITPACWVQAPMFQSVETEEFKLTMAPVSKTKRLVIIEGKNIARTEIYEWQRNLQALALDFQPPGCQPDMSIIHRRQGCITIIMIWTSIK